MRTRTAFGGVQPRALVQYFLYRMPSETAETQVANSCSAPGFGTQHRDAAFNFIISSRGGRSMSEAKTFVWKKNMACVATYNILEGDKFLDQFEDVDVPFDDAGKLKIKQLRSFPGATNNPA